MACPTFQKFPDDSGNRDDDLFEELPDGSTVWRGRVFGMGATESRLRELARLTPNKLFALHLFDRSTPALSPFKLQTRRAS
jgi:hypothetical protein